MFTPLSSSKKYSPAKQPPRFKILGQTGSSAPWRGFVGRRAMPQTIVSSQLFADWATTGRSRLLLLVLSPRGPRRPEARQRAGLVSFESVPIEDPEEGPLVQLVACMYRSLLSKPHVVETRALATRHLATPRHPRRPRRTFLSRRTTPSSVQSVNLTLQLCALAALRVFTDSRTGRRSRGGLWAASFNERVNGRQHGGGRRGRRGPVLDLHRRS